jgi:hypothetical protein
MEKIPHDDDREFCLAAPETHYSVSSGIMTIRAVSPCVVLLCEPSGRAELNSASARKSQAAAGKDGIGFIDWRAFPNFAIRAGGRLEEKKRYGKFLIHSSSIRSFQFPDVNSPCLNPTCGLWRLSGQISARLISSRLISEGFSGKRHYSDSLNSNLDGIQR